MAPLPKAVECRFVPGKRAGSGTYWGAAGGVHMGSNTRQSLGWWRWICACSAVAALGCGSHAPVCHGPRCEELDVRVLTWWRVTNNGPAASLVDATEVQPGVGTVRLHERETKTAMMTAVESLLHGTEGAEPFDTFLANAGRDVLRWTHCGGEGSSERLLRLDGQGAYPNLSASFDPDVLAGVTCCEAPGCAQRGVYAVPLGLHQINHIFFNVERFSRCPGMKVDSVATLIELLTCLGKEGQRVISAPVSECTADCQLGELSCSTCQALAGESLSYLLESLALLLENDPVQDQSRWPDQSWRSMEAARLAPSLNDALALLEGELLPYLNNCSGPACKLPVTAAEALAEVTEGTAAILVMPDWYTLDAQQKSHGALGQGAFPGTEDTFSFMTDVFAVPIAGTPGASVEAGLRWLDTLLELDVQKTFARRKPARAALDDHSQLRLRPSLETQLPVSVDPAEVRASLDQWHRALPPPAAATSQPGAPELGQEQLPLPLPVAPVRAQRCAGSRCGAF